MRPPVEFQDREAYKARMNELLELDPQETVALTIDMQRDYLDATVGSAPVPEDLASRLVDTCGPSSGSSRSPAQRSRSASRSRPRRWVHGAAFFDRGADGHAGGGHSQS